MQERDNRLRFSIRKLTIGAVSVMFGAVIFGVSTAQVHADVNDNSDSQAKTDSNSETAVPVSKPDKVVVNVNKTADSSQSAATQSQVKIVTGDPTKSLPKGQGRLVVNYLFNDPDNGFKTETEKSEQYVGPIGSVIPAKQILNHIPEGFYSLPQINVTGNPKYEGIKDQTIETDIYNLQVNPDGSGEKAIPTCNIYLKRLEKGSDKYERTVHFELEDGGWSTGAKTPANISQALVIPSHERLDEDGNLVIDKEGGTLPRVDIPKVPGYVTEEEYVEPEIIAPVIGRKLVGPFVNHEQTQSDTVYVKYYLANRERNVIYRDVEDNQNVKTDTLKGTVGNAISYNLSLPDGYALAPGQERPANLIPIEIDNPDIIVKVVPLKTENNRYIRIIHYQYADGTKAAEDNNLVVNFTRNQYVDENGYAEWGAWDKNSIVVPTVISPKIANYTPERLEIPERVVTPGVGSDEVSSPSSVPTLKEEHTVIYDPDSESIRVVYRDSESKKFIKIDSLNGKYGQTVSYTATLPDGYAFHHDQLLPTSIKFGEKQNNHDITIWLDPLQTETNRYIRTIHYQYADGTKVADDYNLSFDFIRTQHVDKNGYAEWGAWNKDHIVVPDVVSKNISGYTPTYEKIAGRMVTPGVGFDEAAGLSGVPTLKEVYMVTYNANKPAQPSQPTSASKPTEPVKPSQPTQATNASQPTNAPVKPEQPTKPAQPSNQPTNAPVLPEQPTEPTQTSNQPTNAPVLPQEPTDDHSGEENVRPHAQEDNKKSNHNYRHNSAKKNTSVRPLANEVKTNVSTTSQKELPQTGDAKTNAGIVGLALTGLSMLGLAADRKRKN